MEPKAPNPLTPVRRALAAAALAATVCSGCMTPATTAAKPEVVTTVAITADDLAKYALSSFSSSIMTGCRSPLIW